MSMFARIDVSKTFLVFIFGIPTCSKDRYVCAQVVINRDDAGILISIGVGETGIVIFIDPESSARCTEVRTLIIMLLFSSMYIWSGMS